MDEDKKMIQQLKDENLRLIEEIIELKALDKISRENEEKYRNLFNLMDKPFCIIEILFDSKDTPIDWRFIETNAAYQKKVFKEKQKQNLLVSYCRE